MVKKLIKWLSIFVFVLAGFLLVSTLASLYLWDAGEDIHIFSNYKISDEIKGYNERMFDKEKVTVDKEQAIAKAEELLTSGDNIKKFDELSARIDTKSYLEVCHYNPEQKQYFLLLEKPEGDLADNFTTRLCHRVMFTFENPEDFTEVLIGAEDGLVASWMQGGNKPKEIDYFSVEPPENYVAGQSLDVDHDGNEEKYFIAYPDTLDSQGLVPVYYLSYEYIEQAKSWIWNYRLLRAVKPERKDNLKDMVSINMIDDMTGDKMEEILIMFKDSKLLVLLESRHYLWTDLLYYGDLPGGEYKIKGNKLIISESAWAEGDPQCCPSQRLETVYYFDGKRMVREVE